MRHAAGTATVEPMSTRAADPGGSGPATRPRRRWRWWQALLVVGAVMVLLFGAWVALAVVNVSGGLDDFLAGDPPRKGDPEVVALRQRASEDLAAHSAQLVTTTITPALGAAAAPVGRGEVAPPCEAGQHNWKVDHDFDLACELRWVEVVAVEDQATFFADMAALDSALRGDGWSSDAYGMDGVLTDYRNLARKDSTTSPDAQTDPDNISMEDLPAVEYTKTVEGQTRMLAVGWAEAQSRAIAVTPLEPWAAFHTVDGREVQPAALIDAIPADGYAVVVTESVQYFIR